MARDFGPFGDILLQQERNESQVRLTTIKVEHLIHGRCGFQAMGELSGKGARGKQDDETICNVHYDRPLAL